MINLPYISMPDHFTRLLVSNIQNSPQTNTNLEMYINENQDLNIIIKKAFKDIDPDGFVGKIISVSGFLGIRNRLSAIFLEYAQTGFFPENANLSLTNDMVNIENKLRHFTVTGFSRAYLLAFYAKMTLVKINQMEEVHHFTPLIIKDEHIELMKYSKAKSTRIDWLMLQIILFENVLGLERLQSFLQGSMKFSAIFNMLKEDEKDWFIQNLLTYGASILDFEFFLTDTTLVKE